MVKDGSPLLKSLSRSAEKRRRFNLTVQIQILHFSILPTYILGPEKIRMSGGDHRSIGSLGEVSILSS